jgi:hypothetical protein
MEVDVESYLRRRYESQIADIEIIEKEDLELVSNCSFCITSLIICFVLKNLINVIHLYCFLSYVAM